MNLLYAARSLIVNGLSRAMIGLVSDRGRPGAFFRGRLAEPLLFREGMAALHAVVTSDLKYRPPDRLAWKAWQAEQDRLFLAGLAIKSLQAKAKSEKLHARLAELDAARRQRLAPFDAARRRFFDYIWGNEYELRLLLDPVITVHPDEVSFEAFSRDESTYARLAAKLPMFEKVDSFACGTTNIDFSLRLHTEMERLRSYRGTELAIGPEGFAASANTGPSPIPSSALSGSEPAGTNGVLEKKIDLPDSWVKGFLQVHSTMTLGLTRFRISPTDMLNVLRVLRTRRAKTSPRALRYELRPGQPTRAVLEPWEHVVEFGPSSVYDGPKPLTIRTWGRDRLLLAARLLPVCRSVDVYLAGMGLPTIYVLELGPAETSTTASASAVFTLGLSGWTDNDWTGAGSGAGGGAGAAGGGMSPLAKFALLSRPIDVSAGELTTVYNALADAKFGTEAFLSLKTGLSRERTRSALSSLCQVGRAMFDLGGGVYRFRELFNEPFTATAAAKAVQPPEMHASAIPTKPGASGKLYQQSSAGSSSDSSSSDNSGTASGLPPEQNTAESLHAGGDIRIIARRPVADGYKLSGSAADNDDAPAGSTGRVRPLLHIDPTGRIIEASCTCRHYQKHRMTQGPCAHVLALRLAHMDRLEAEKA